MYGQSQTSNKQKNKHDKRKLIILVSVVIVIAIIAGVYVINRQKDQKNPVPTSNNEASRANKTSKNSPNASTSDTNNPNKTVPTQGGDVLAPPTGSFVSNHKPNLSGSPLPSKERSVCSSAVGASCYIAFTKGGATKKLAAQTTDSSGNTSWDWDINSLGLTEGSWQISAVTTLNSQSATAQDSLPLEVRL